MNKEQVCFGFDTIDYNYLYVNERSDTTLNIRAYHDLDSLHSDVYCVHDYSDTTLLKNCQIIIEHTPFYNKLVINGIKLTYDRYYWRTKIDEDTLNKFTVDGQSRCGVNRSWFGFKYYIQEGIYIHKECIDKPNHNSMEYINVPFMLKVVRA